MIVQPDFPDHYKTKMLVDLTGDPAAPIMLLRLWAHCQHRRTSRFRNLAPAAVKAICRADAMDAARFHAILLEVGFLDLEGDETVVHDWDQVNGSLLRNWENGKKGGRPRKVRGSAPRGEDGNLNVPAVDQAGSDGVPPADKRTGKNPNETLGFRGVNPNETDREDRVEKSREDSSLREGEGKPSLSAGADGKSEDGNLNVPAVDQAGSDGVPPADKRTPSPGIRDLFHSLCPTLPRIQKIDGTRQKQVAARWREAGKTDGERLEWFRTLFRMAGESKRIREGTWCGFDWLMKPTNSQKVLEGNYANSRETTPKKVLFDAP